MFLKKDDMGLRIMSLIVATMRSIALVLLRYP
jgi:hypothetical protein